MSHKNGIITPFIELGPYMRLAIDMAKRSDKYPFDTNWINTLYTKCSSHAKRLNTIYMSHTNKRDSPVLSKKEFEVLQNLSQGMTREEIADINGVTIHTARGYIKNVYNKLGATNSAEAVHIAHLLGLL